MLIKKKKYFNIKENKVTDEISFINRRNLIKGLSSFLLYPDYKHVYSNQNNQNSFNINIRPPTKYEVITKYNNYFEFGTSKQIWKSAQKLETENWFIKIKGGKFDGKDVALEKLIKNIDLEERIYKFRCVEAWSMIIPWYGFQLSNLIKILEPENNIKFVLFKTFFNPKVASNQKQKWYPWPYQEIITIEEALNPLAFIATGLYGKNLPKQNGAPLRLVLPWKYGFKSIKSITHIEFLKDRKKSFWQTIAPNEYGFWANVNPNVPHRRWSQQYEKDIGSGNKYPTKIFNGYEKWVKSLYKNIKNEPLFL
ncbi:MAG: protein-methionine-sulfoxide reductase catalytic subunit MsrP [Rickettsiales bacterium]|mgnify:CR=1 FL=1|nr:protein-methionine-sulfoxide reductase catalytic subunit MsrP [Rickettsiales bacterium]OUV83522.1 MAG: mononuclear molybdenum enzyme YedY [Rickettsiales bacterium TMED131]